MIAEKKIEIAEQAYIRAVAEIKKICDIKRGVHKYTKEYGQTLYYFESAVQGVLLYAVLEIGEMSEASAGFIKNNIITGNFIESVNEIGMMRLFRNWEKLSWDNICSHHMPQDKVKEIMKEAIGNTVRSFVYPIASVDSDITAKNYANTITSYIKTILHAVCSPDIALRHDIPEDSEEFLEYKMQMVEKTLNAIEAGINVFNDAFLIYWKGSSPMD